jgi:dTDP-4-dehydrorhamnose 3,5-epimerase-like enzyme
VASGVGDTLKRGVAATFEDPRGKLTLVPMDEIPFVPTRAYVLSEMPVGTRRAGHACRTQHRYLVCLRGSAQMTLYDGRATRTVELVASETIHITPLTWHELQSASDDVSILVFADGSYEQSDYIEDRTAVAHAHETAAQTASA